MPIENGSQLCKEAAEFLLQGNVRGFMPYKQVSRPFAIYLGRHSTELSTFLRQVANGFLDLPVYQEVALSTILNNSELSQKIHDEFKQDNLLVTDKDSLEDKIFSFTNTPFILDVVTLKFLMQSCRWVELLEYCSKHANKLVIMGTMVKDRYVHHLDIPKLDPLVLVPQFLSDTSEPPELEIGTQLLKKKNESKKRSVDKA